VVFTCKSCGAKLAKEDIDFPTGIASCSHCHAVMSFAAELGLKPPQAPPPPPVPEQRALVPRPAAIQVDDQAHRLRLTRRWFSPVILFLTVFCIFWDGFLVFWYSMAFFGAREVGPAGLIMVLFPLIHVAVGVGMTYFVICGYVNRTVVEVTEAECSIRHEPMPWWGNRSLRRDQVRQLYCMSHYHRSKNGGGSTTYSVNAILADGQKVKLLESLTEMEAALYYEQQIEQRLGIKDERVAGEVSRGGF